MTQNNPDILSQTLGWFELAVPNPTDKNRGVQLGVHFEEVAEMLDTITGYDTETALLLMQANQAMERLASHLKANPQSVLIHESDRKEFLDSVADQIVTATGSAYMFGMNPVDGLAEVNRSNYSKFVDGKPIFNEQGKIIKGPDYFKPDLSRFV